MVDAVVCLLIFVAVFAVFGQTARHEFVNLDDSEYVYENAHVCSGLSAKNIAWAFSSRVSYQWHPLTLISLMADAELAKSAQGSPDSARLATLMHLDNVVLHTANALLLYLLLRVSTANVWPGAAVAATFAVHPLHVESVAWITERKDVLSGLFGLLALLAYVGYARSPSFVRWLAVAVALALGFSADRSWSLGRRFLCLDYWPLGRWGRVFQCPAPTRLVLEKLPFVLFAIASVAARFILQARAAAPMWARDRCRFRKGSPMRQVLRRLLRQAPLACEPAAIYPVRPLAGYWPAIRAAATLVFISASAVWFARRTRTVPRPWLAVGWFWFCSPSFRAFVWCGWIARNGRSIPLPSADRAVRRHGLAARRLCGTVRLAAARRSRRHCSVIASRFVPGVKRHFGANDLTLWTRTVTARPATRSLACTWGWLSRARRVSSRRARYQEALRDDPRFYKAHFNMAAALSSLGDIGGAAALSHGP